MHLVKPFFTPLVLLLGALLLFSACDSDSQVIDPGNGDNSGDPNFDFRQVTYDLSATANDGQLADGVDATATFQELSGSETLVTLELSEGATGTALGHTAHIHENDVEAGGGIAIFLGPIDGLGGALGTSRFVVESSFDDLVSFDGYINVHESNAALGNILAQGNIGANAEDAEIVMSDLTPLSDGDTIEYDLPVVGDNGFITEGAQATFTELTDTQTIVKLELTEGATSTQISHTAHIHANDVATGGDIVFFLGPIDGLDAAPGVSYALLEESYDTLVEFDGYINIHESNASLANILAQGNIGSNASSEDGATGGY